MNLFVAARMARVGFWMVVAFSAAAVAGHEPRQVDDLKMTLMPISAGRFTMGSPDDEAGRRNNEGPLTQVTITKDFWVDRTEVTQAQWRALMGTDVTQQLRLALTDDTLYDIDGTRRTVRDYYKTPKEFNDQRFTDNRSDDAPMYWVNWN